MPASNKRTLPCIRILALLFVVGLTLFIYNIRDQTEQLAAYGYPGIFLLALLTNATVFLPAPGVTVVFAMGAIFSPLWVGVAAGAGGALGELSGYMAGFSGQGIIEKRKLFNRLHGWVEKYGFWAILCLAAIPNPTFDIAGLAAGMLKMPLPKFLLAVWIGVSIKMLSFAYAGAYSIDLLITE